ncbi:response regulator transcription factor [Alcaligenes ammonioxydans]|jgi:two-component system OmpR family response regulator|uniref:response regulator transcription factor n=1 Tax=Alcaligenes TaxID=507 RepID=UPI000269EA8E|nr:response regulator transcription factor [Alcaligenes ammonioxydans]EJC62884.1 two-component response regulator [Alcaligenes faecalis subsp. faecalis NCIB 8687]QBH19013.1 response regulator transcription factor [Alcaligenes faecalis]MCH1880336.1 response regulator transcription factor [Alcaligenes ammonioxydans]WGQ35093.1 response regulator transcription factor [Alcaligenes faecalis]HRK87315.1 response regulator transcription factor [Alcaligenes faecalis]
MSVANELAGGPVVLYLATAIADRIELEQKIQALAERGYRLIFCPDVTALLQSAQTRTRHAGTVCIAWLGGGLAEICSAAVRLRMLCPQIGILMQSEATDSAMLQALHSGGDQFCPKQASLELLAASLHSLQRRLMQIPSIPEPSATQEWVLDQEGWTLISPVGMSFSLTSTERAFMVCLLAREDRRASHYELMCAVASKTDVISNPPSALHINRLGVLVSRMRRKFSQGGTTLPIRSLHNWGYMFAANCQLLLDGARD